MRNIPVLLFAASIFLAPSSGLCDAQADAKISAAMEKPKAMKPEGVQFNAMTTEGGKVIVEGYAESAAAVAGLLKSIRENSIGTPGIREVSPAEAQGKPLSHFAVWVKVVDVAEPPRPSVDEILASAEKHPPPGDAAPPFVTLHQVGDLAWWHGAEFHPSGKDIRGIPIKSIDPSWCAANEFKRALFPEEVVEGDLGIKEIMGDKDSFAIEGKFDGVHQLTALVGVFETCGKKTATFLLLLDPKNQKKPVVSLIKYDIPFFAYLMPEKNNEFSVLDCYACSESILYKWDKSSKTLVGTALGEGD